MSTTIAPDELTATARGRATLRPSLHSHPPATPSSFYNGRRRLLVAAGVTFAVLAVAAALHGAWLPLRWDLPIQRFVEAHRTNSLDSLFLTVSRLGSTLVVVAASAVLVFLTWSRCRAVSIAIVAAALTRPLLEFVLKALVGRARPDLGRMVIGEGFSFPSGHVLAAIALYGLVPAVVGLFTRSRLLWWASASASGVVIVAIAASRVYLGVHWTTDVLGSLLLGSFFLLGVEAVLAYVHRVGGCADADLSARRALVPHRITGRGGMAVVARSTRVH
jgi:undecaprenyl-diphosphatase